MGKEDLFRRSFEAGTAFLGMTRERAETLVRELVKAGEVSKGKAQKLADDLLERSRRGTEELREVVRREMNEQVAALGLATKDDIRRLEQRLDAMAGVATGGRAQPGQPAQPPRSTKTAGVKKAGARKRTAVKRTAPASTADPTRAAAAASPARPTRARKTPPAAGPGPSGSAPPPTGGPPADGPPPG